MPYTGTAPLSPPTRISSTDPDPVAVMAAREAAARAAHVRIEKAKVRRGAEGVRGRGRPRRLASGQPNARAGAIGPVEHAEVNGANTSRQRAPPVFFFFVFRRAPISCGALPLSFSFSRVSGRGRPPRVGGCQRVTRAALTLPHSPHTPHPTPHTAHTLLSDRSCESASRPATRKPASTTCRSAGRLSTPTWRPSRAGRGRPC